MPGVGGARRESQGRVGAVMARSFDIKALVLLMLAATSGAALRAQTVDVPLRSLDSLTTAERGADGFMALDQKAAAWQRSMLWMVSSTSASGDVSAQATPFELSARRASEQWSISGAGLQRVSVAGQSRAGLGDMLVAYDRLMPIGTTALAAGRLGLIVPSGSRVSSDRPQLLAAALMRIKVAEAVALVPVVVLTAETRDPPPGLSRHAAELRFKVEGRIGSGTVMHAGARSAHRSGVDSTSTIELGWKHSLAGNAQLLVEGRRALSSSARTSTVDAGVLWAF